MRTIWHSLAWKEWHEHKWKLVAITVVMWSVVAFVMLFSFWDRYVLATTQFAIISALVPMAVFAGASAAAGEQSHRSLAFLQSLPIPLWRVACLKLVFGMISLVVPLLLTLGFVMVGCIILAAAGIDSRAIDDISESFISNDWRLSTVLVERIEKTKSVQGPWLWPQSSRGGYCCGFVGAYFSRAPLIQTLHGCEPSASAVLMAACFSCPILHPTLPMS
jgi:hypothetical protein